ncbi:hypothetical protein GCM10011341_29700 [Frigidibacter albus]|nr:hypothetical protein GCM10011341_29700 [Frigidibacter albus]
MRISVVVAGFAPSEAGRLRRSLATLKRMGTLGGFRDRFVGCVPEGGWDADFAAESHATGFAWPI